MKLKYYLRGLGIGIFITALIFTITNHLDNKISDKEVIERASKLGMVMKEEETLFPQKETTGATEELTTEAPTEKPTTEAPTEEPTTEEPTTEKPTTEEPTTEAPTEEPTTEAPTEPPTEAPTAPPVYTVTIEIKPGMYSEAVSQLMQEVGLISNWRDFNDYLSLNRLTDRISTGTFTLNTGMSFEEMAAVILF